MPVHHPLPPSPHSGLLLGRLLEEISINLQGNDQLASFATSIKRELKAAPRVPIQVLDWSRCELLSGTPYVGEPTLNGTLEDALRIAGDLFARGLEVQLKHREGAILIWVDDHGFHQR